MAWEIRKWLDMEKTHPGIEPTHVSCITRLFFTAEPAGKPVHETARMVCGLQEYPSQIPARGQLMN